jgi:CheY-like chemotaxis protein
MKAAGRRESRILPYVLIATGDLSLAATCLSALKPFRLGALVGRDSDEALEILQRFGPPTLLLCEASLPPRDGFSLIEAVRAAASARLPIIVVSAFESVRGYASHRNDLRIGAIVSASASLSEFSEAIHRVLTSAQPEPMPPGVAELIDRVMRDATEDTIQITGARGAAAYLQLGDEERFRAHVSWISEGSASASPFAPPQHFDWIKKAGAAIVLPDLAMEPLVSEPAAIFQQVVRGIIAAPIIDAGAIVIGALCAFDVRPLNVGAVEIDALRCLALDVGRTLRGT